MQMLLDLENERVNQMKMQQKELQKAAFLREQEEKNKRAQEIMAKKEARDKEFQQKIEEGKKKYKEVTNKKPLFMQLEEQY
jgi:hypothetical protein